MPQEDDKNCQDHMKPVCDGTKSQSTKYNESVCFDKNCQETQNINMQPVKPSMDMWSKEPAIQLQSSFKKKMYPYVVTRTVNLQDVTGNLNIPSVTRAVKKPNLFICGD